MDRKTGTINETQAYRGSSAKAAACASADEPGLAVRGAVDITRNLYIFGSLYLIASSWMSKIHHATGTATLGSSYETHAAQDGTSEVPSVCEG